MGNVHVNPETADTWTLGTVISSPFEAAALQSVRVSLDYYRLKVTDALGPQSVDIAQRQCFDPAFNRIYSGASPNCAGINRVANDGALDNISTTYLNIGRRAASILAIPMEDVQHAEPRGGGLDSGAAVAAHTVDQVGRIGGFPDHDHPGRQGLHVFAPNGTYAMPIDVTLRFVVGNLLDKALPRNCVSSDLQA